MKQSVSLFTALLVLTAIFTWQSAVVSSPSASIHASVVDFQSRAPLAQVRVSVFEQRGTKALATALSDKKGAFTLSNLRGGLYRLELAKPGYHETMVAGLPVKTGEHLSITGPIGMFSEKVPVPAAQITRDPCKDLVNPGQTADVYVVCGGK